MSRHGTNVCVILAEHLLVHHMYFLILGPSVFRFSRNMRVTIFGFSLTDH